MLDFSGALITAMASLSAALVIWPGDDLVALARLCRLSSTDAAQVDPLSRKPTKHLRATLCGCLAGSSILVTFPSPGGAAVAVATCVVVYVLLIPAAAPGSRAGPAGALGAVLSVRGRLGPTTVPDPRWPFAIDLLAVCVRGGLSTPAALRSVAFVLAGPCSADRRTPDRGALPDVSTVLGRAAAAAELGSDPAGAWRDWVGHPVYGQMARALIITGESGSAVAGRLEAAAKQLRNAAGHEAVTRAQRAGVALMAPLGLCFLPAFVCLGVVPVVVGIAGQVFG